MVPQTVIGRLVGVMTILIGFLGTSILIPVMQMKVSLAPNNLLASRSRAHDVTTWRISQSGALAKGENSWRATGQPNFLFLTTFILYVCSRS